MPILGPIHGDVCVCFPELFYRAAHAGALLLTSYSHLIAQAIIVLCFGISAKLYEYSFKGMLADWVNSDLQSLLATLQQMTGALTVAFMMTGSFILHVSDGP